MKQQVFVFRHARYEDEPDHENEGHLTQDGINQARAKGAELLKKLGVSISVSDILFLTSLAPRARQTTHAIIEGMGLLDNPHIHVLEELWKDSEHKGDLEVMLAFIKDLPPNLFLIIVTHQPFVYPVAKKLGYSGAVRDSREVKYLDHVAFIRDLPDAGASNLGVPEYDPTMEGGTFQYNVTLRDELNSFQLVRIIQGLQQQKGTWQIFQDDEHQQEYQFLVPDIKPSGDIESSMNGTYNVQGSHPVVITFATPQELQNAEAGKLARIPVISQQEAMGRTFRKLELTKPREVDASEVEIMGYILKAKMDALIPSMVVKYQDRLYYKWATYAHGDEDGWKEHADGLLGDSFTVSRFPTGKTGEVYSAIFEAVPKNIDSKIYEDFESAHQAATIANNRAGLDGVLSGE